MKKWIAGLLLVFMLSGCGIDTHAPDFGTGNATSIEEPREVSDAEIALLEVILLGLDDILYILFTGQFKSMDPINNY